MDRNIFDQTLRAFKVAKPFRPFTVVLVNGDRVNVDDPEAFIIRDGVSGFIGRDGLPNVFWYDGVDRIDEVT